MKGARTYARIWYKCAKQSKNTVLVLAYWREITISVDYGSTVRSYEIPDNNTCEDTTVISTNILTYINHMNTDGARHDFNLFSKLCGGVATSCGVWYSFVGNGKLASIFYTNSLSRNTQMSLILISGPCNINMLVCEENYGSISSIQSVLVNDNEYRLLLAGNSFLAVGEYDLTIVQYEPPQNDTCNDDVAVIAFHLLTLETWKGAITPDFNADNVQCSGSTLRRVRGSYS